MGLPGCRENRCSRTEDNRGPPFDQFVESAEGKADADHEKEEPFAGMQRRAPYKDLARDHGRDEALSEVPEPVEMIAAEIEGLLDPGADRDPGIGIVAADHQDERMQEYETVQQRRERESGCRCAQSRGTATRTGKTSRTHVVRSRDGSRTGRGRQAASASRMSGSDDLKRDCSLPVGI